MFLKGTLTVLGQPHSSNHSGDTSSYALVPKVIALRLDQSDSLSDHGKSDRAYVT